MKTGQILTTLFVSLFCAMPVSAVIYKCTKGSSVVYTGFPAKGCIILDASNSPLSVITKQGGDSTPESNASPTSATAEAPPAGSDKAGRINAAQAALEASQKALIDGRAKRDPIELNNYSLYLKRVQGLEDDLVEKQKQLDEVKRGP